MKKVPEFKTDAEAEAFLDQDLSDLDFSQFKPTRFEFERKAGRLNMRLPDALLEAVKARARQRGMPLHRLHPRADRARSFRDPEIVRRTARSRLQGKPPRPSARATSGPRYSVTTPALRPSPDGNRPGQGPNRDNHDACRISPWEKFVPNLANPPIPTLGSVAQLRRCSTLSSRHSQVKS
jgi:predicted DNA binding CopG/RHH family protein